MNLTNGSYWLFPPAIPICYSSLFLAANLASESSSGLWLSSGLLPGSRIERNKIAIKLP